MFHVGHVSVLWVCLCFRPRSVLKRSTVLPCWYVCCLIDRDLQNQCTGTIPPHLCHPHTYI